MRKALVGWVFWFGFFGVDQFWEFFCFLVLFLNQLLTLVQKMQVIRREWIFLESFKPYPSISFSFPDGQYLCEFAFQSLSTCKHEAMLLPVSGARVAYGTGMKIRIYIYRTHCHRWMLPNRCGHSMTKWHPLCRDILSFHSWAFPFHDGGF